MSAKEKAKEIFSKMELRIDGEGWYESAKECAIIAVDEMIIQNGDLYLNSLGDKTVAYYKAKNAYLFDVKSEIEKL